MGSHFSVEVVPASVSLTHTLELFFGTSTFFQPYHNSLQQSWQRHPVRGFPAWSSSSEMPRLPALPLTSRDLYFEAHSCHPALWSQELQLPIMSSLGWSPQLLSSTPYFPISWALPLTLNSGLSHRFSLFSVSWCFCALKHSLSSPEFAALLSYHLGSCSSLLRPSQVSYWTRFITMCCYGNIFQSKWQHHNCNKNKSQQSTSSQI